MGKDINQDQAKAIYDACQAMLEDGIDNDRVAYIIFTTAAFLMEEKATGSDGVVRPYDLYGRLSYILYNSMQAIVKHTTEEESED